MERFFENFELLTNYLKSKNLTTFICMDSNINLLNINDNPNAMEFLNNVYDYGFMPVNFKATRMSNHSFSLIDQILCNDISSCVSSGSIIDDLSDHWFTFVQLKLNRKHKVKPGVNKRRLITHDKLCNFRDSLSMLSWNDTLSTDDVDVCYDSFWSHFKTLYDLHFPVVTTRFNRNYNKISDFMTLGLLVSRRTKINLLKRSLNEPTDLNKQAYKTYRNLYNKLLKIRKKDHLHERLKNCQKNPKKTWEILREITGKSKNSKEKIEKLCSAGNTITGSLNVANEFNKFFCNIGNKISNSVSETNAKPEDYLRRPSPNLVPLELGALTQAEFISIINEMDPKSSADIHGISNKMIKFLKFELATPLVHLFNLSFQTGRFPNKLKCSRTIPIFKNGEKTLCDNYRPISLLSSLSKILEKAVANRLVNHLTYNKLLYEGQFGFQGGVSTVHHLLTLTNYVSDKMNKKHYTVGIFLDLKKAFDVVPHNILLKKLEYLGINGIALNWFRNYLEGRTQCVDIDGNLSEVLNLTISILQGSILGPILFLCFINDLPNCTELFSLLFADDTAALTSGPELQPVLDKANSELQKIAMWFRANKMAVNVSKTKFIIFKPKGKKVELHAEQGVFFNDNDIGQLNPDKIYKLDRIYDNNPVPQDRTYKLLGVLLDEHLSFNQHCMYISNKIAQSNFIIAKTKNLLPRNILKNLYYALVHPHLLYCIPIYSCTSIKNNTKLYTMQKKAIRNVCNARYNEHSVPLFKLLGILPLNELAILSKSLLLHSIVHKYGPRILEDQWQTNGERNPNVELRNRDDLYVPTATSEQVSKLPVISFPKLWNSLPIEKLYPNRFLFSNLIKEYLWNTLVPQ
jgi:hypothetical protein